MKLKKVNDSYTMYEFTPSYVFEALRMSDNLEIDLKTPFGHLTKETIGVLAKYKVDVQLISQTDRGCVYRITRRIEGDDESE